MQEVGHRSAPSLREVCRAHIDDNALPWELVSATLDGRDDAVLTLLDSRVGEANKLEVRATSTAYLYRHRTSLDAL